MYMYTSIKTLGVKCVRLRACCDPLPGALIGALAHKSTPRGEGGAMPAPPGCHLPALLPVRLSLSHLLGMPYLPGAVPCRAGCRAMPGPCPAGGCVAMRCDAGAGLRTVPGCRVSCRCLWP